jgi:hypothetical protein
MANERMKEDWRLIQERIRNIWDDIEFSEDDMKRGRADLSEMIAVISEKTEESREEVLSKLEAVIY